MTVSLLFGSPGEFSEAEKIAFITLVYSGGEVRKSTLQDNVKTAVRLVFLRDAGDLIGVAALKVPIHTYRDTLFAKTDVILGDAEVPYEVGYILVKETARGQGFSNVLVGTALDAAVGRGIFATSRSDNIPMHKTLARFGFEKVGKPFIGKDAKEKIQLFLRRGQ